MNVLDAIDPDGEVTRAAAEAQVALEAGDTARARHLFTQAAQRLNKNLQRGK